jgi:hypothetical protein
MHLRLTWNNIAGIHRILILDEAETIHQLHLCDFSGAMFREMRLDIGLGSCRQRVSGCERERQIGLERSGPLRGRFPR